MKPPERHLRLVQIGCIFLVAACIAVRYMGSHQARNAITITQAVVILAAVWSGISGFTMQRRFQNKRTVASSKSTPFTRWRAGHLVRLSSAAAVGGWGLVLYDVGGPSWLVASFFAVALLLLLIWQPADNPARVAHSDQ
jgi:hypothetical protein